MVFFSRKTNAFRAVIAGFLGITVTLLAGCSSEEQAVPPTPAPIEGFAFFDVGAMTPYSNAMRDRLGDILGSDAIQHRNIINLEVNWKGFLKKHFPALHDLNLDLNSPVGERVEHDTVKLMYRYAQNKNLPFNYIELVFSNHSQKPLFIHITSRRDLSDVFRALEDKFGKPIKIGLPPETGEAMYWREENDVLLVTIAPSRRGGYMYRIMIYFADNIAELVSLEEKERRAREEDKRRAGESAF